tara:strand:- start:893 stop:2728 length:1836 start_codon:yes stop_codon:yes gene_type:complete
MSEATRAIGEALDSLTNKIFDEYFARKDNDLMQKQQLTASLFQNQMNLENEYRTELINAGVSLPDEFKSSNYIDIVNQAGNQPLLNTLNKLYEQSTINLDNLTNVKSSFSAGQKIAQDYSSGMDIDGDGTIDIGSFTAGETGIAPYMYSPDEQKALFESFDQIGLDPNLPNTPGFAEGFQSINTQQLALERASAAASLKQSNLHIANANLDLASKELSVATMELGPGIVSQLSGSSPIFSKLAVIKRGLMGDKDQVDVAMEEWNTMMQDIQTNFPAIATSLSSGVANYVERDQTDGISGPYDGFITVMSNAYNDLEQYLSIMDPSMIDENGNWIGDTSYTALHDRVTQYQMSGILARDMGGSFDLNLLELSVGVDMAKDNIMSSFSTLNENNAQDLLAQGFGYNAINDSLEFIDKSSEQFMDFNNENNPAYEAWLDSQLEDPINPTIDDSNKIDLSNIAGLPQNIIELSQEVEANQINIDKARDLTKNVARKTVKFGGAGMEWADNPNQGKDLSVYVPTNTEIERIKEKFVKRQVRRLDPEVPNTLLENVPLVGLLTQFFPQGPEGVVSEYPEVVKQFEEFNAWIDEINEMRSLRGEIAATKIDIQNLMNN